MRVAASSMSEWTEIIYRDFYDVPRVFLTRRGDRYLLFDCPFDEALDDYPTIYKVYLMADLPDERLGGSWVDIHHEAERYLGEIPVDRVSFDPTRRRTVDLQGIVEWGKNLGWWQAES